jgi:hypothetical protein
MRSHLQVHDECFFQGAQRLYRPAGHSALSDCALIANPPYLPAPDADILMPDLFGCVLFMQAPLAWQEGQERSR